ncbi:hypothetical protein [Halopenitus persicus]|nr:hypothetical protein [Halopenitus persicus]
MGPSAVKEAMTGVASEAALLAAGAGVLAAAVVVSRTNAGDGRE